MGAMPCWMFRLLSGMWQLLDTDWQSGSGVRWATPRRTLLSFYFHSAWTPFIFLHPEAPLSLPGIPSILW